MEEKILNLLKNQNYSLDILENKLDIDKKELLCIIDDLMHQRKIFFNSHNKVCLITDEHIVSEIWSNSKGQKYIVVGKEKYFISPEDLHTAFKNDLVVVEIYKNNYANVLGIVERKNNRLVCEVKSKNSKLYLAPFNIGCEVSVTLADKKLLKDFVVGDRVVINLENKIDETNTIVANNVVGIGHKDDPKSDEISIAISKDFDIDFSIEAIKESILIPDVVEEKDKIGRINLTQDTIFTIDSVHTKDMDDAVSIRKLYNGNYLLGVHIADVAHYVKPGSALFKDAEKRATSLYLGDTVIPMIPHKLSNGICSLNEGVERLTKSCLMEIDHKGKVVNYKIVNSVIESKKKMSYEEINALFNGEEVDESYAPFIYDLTIMKELSDILSHAKEKRGNIEFESNEIEVSNDEAEKPISFKEREIGTAEAIIENFMIIANEVIATYFYWQDLPFIYRVHNIPDEVKMEKTMELIENIGPKLIKLQNSYGQKAIQNILTSYEGTPEYSIISNLLLRNMAKAKYSTKNVGHFALALDNYCHFTSPIRRFPDLAIHHLLNIFNKDYSKNNLTKIESKLEKICDHSSYKERQANDAEKDYLKLKMAKYMENFIGDTFEGTIIDIDHDLVVIKLDNHIKGILSYTEEFTQSFYIDSQKKELKSKYSKTKAKLGSRVIIKVEDVNIPQKEVYFELVEIQKSMELTRKKNNN